MSAVPLLVTEKLDVAIGDRHFCRGLDLALRPGRVVAVLGPNGAGKTTLLHTLAGLRPAAGGTLRLGGRRPADWDGAGLARFRGLLPQQQPDYFASTVLETTLVGRHPHLGRWNWESAEDLAIARQALAAVGMEGLEGRDILSLSGGERQRVALAALLAQAPQLYLLDEPLNHLDLHYQVAMLELFRRLAGAGRGVVLVLHDINLAARFADDVILLDGENAEFGPAAAVLSGERLSHAFRHPLRSFTVDGKAVFLPD
ncbi:MAG: ABC transporter ATP-binding protein [Betaproteobacteria bacterium]